MDLSPEVFGYYSKDGTLIAKILHNYDVIDCNQLETIIRTTDPALCRVNLKHLRVWLRFIGVDCNDQVLKEISLGRGSTSLQLLYKIYLALENKDRLHFITLEKERENFIPTSKKFKVSTVPEEDSPRSSTEDDRSNEILCKGEFNEKSSFQRLPMLQIQRDQVLKPFDGTKIHLRKSFVPAKKKVINFIRPNKNVQYPRHRFLLRMIWIVSLVRINPRRSMITTPFVSMKNFKKNYNPVTSQIERLLKIIENGWNYVKHG